MVIVCFNGKYPFQWSLNWTPTPWQALARVDPESEIKEKVTNQMQLHHNAFGTTMTDKPQHLKTTVKVEMPPFGTSILL